MHDQHRDHKQQHSDGHNGGIKTKSRSREIIAYFPTQAEAQRAARKVNADVETIAINPVSSRQVRQTAANAESGVSIVEIGKPAWIGLATGILLGGILGAIAFSGRVALPGIAQSLSAGPVAVVFLWAGVVGCIGWLVGALISLLRSVNLTTRHEVRVTVGEQSLVNVEQILAQAGALDVMALENENSNQNH